MVPFVTSGCAGIRSELQRAKQVLRDRKKHDAGKCKAWISHLDYPQDQTVSSSMYGDGDAGLLDAVSSAWVQAAYAGAGAGQNLGSGMHDQHSRLIGENGKGDSPWFEEDDSYEDANGEQSGYDGDCTEHYHDEQSKHKDQDDNITG